MKALSSINKLPHYSNRNMQTSRFNDGNQIFGGPQTLNLPASVVKLLRPDGALVGRFSCWGTAAPTLPCPNQRGHPRIRMNLHCTKRAPGRTVPQH